uniref:Secreted protein n=1 Tax=Steinernema glaseri TaxID=37863 RepID=A0A1I7Y8A0_9BILA
MFALPNRGRLLRVCAGTMSQIKETPITQFSVFPQKRTLSSRVLRPNARSLLSSTSSFGGTSFGLFCRSYLNAQTPSAFSSQRIIPCSDHQIRTPCGGDACKRRRAKANSPIYSIARAIALPSRRRKTKSYTAVVAVAKVQNANFLLPTSPTRACSRA